MEGSTHQPRVYLDTSDAQHRTAMPGQWDWLREGHERPGMRHSKAPPGRLQVGSLGGSSSALLCGKVYVHMHVNSCAEFKLLPGLHAMRAAAQLYYGDFGAAHVQACREQLVSRACASQ